MELSCNEMRFREDDHKKLIFKEFGLKTFADKELRAIDFSKIVNLL